MIPDRQESNRRAYGKRLPTADVFADGDGNWLITFSDVMTLLLIFFVMFSLATVETADDRHRAKDAPAAAVFPAPGVSDGDRVSRDEVRDELDSLRQYAGMSGDISVETIERGISVTLREKVTFLPGDARLLEGTEAMLDGIARILKRHDSYLIEISGHTDNVPIRTRGYPSNWELSAARATSVLKYFISKHGIDPARFTIRGDGEQRPLIPNDSPEHRALNRRVEIRLTEREPAL